jgi:hypothetical protein
MIGTNIKALEYRCGVPRPGFQNLPFVVCRACGHFRLRDLVRGRFKFKLAICFSPIFSLDLTCVTVVIDLSEGLL